MKIHTLCKFNIEAQMLSLTVEEHSSESPFAHFCIVSNDLTEKLKKEYRTFKRKHIVQMPFLPCVLDASPALPYLLDSPHNPLPLPPIPTDCREIHKPYEPTNVGIAYQFSSFRKHR